MLQSRWCFNILSNLLFHSENKYNSPFNFHNMTLMFSGHVSYCGIPVLNLCLTQWPQTSLLICFSLQGTLYLLISGFIRMMKCFLSNSLALFFNLSRTISSSLFNLLLQMRKLYLLWFSCIGVIFCALCKGCPCYSNADFCTSRRCWALFRCQVLLFLWITTCLSILKI